MTERIVPLHHRLLVEISAESSVEKVSEGGLFLPGMSNASPSQIRLAKVLAVGSGEILFNGEVRKLKLVEGDTIHVCINDVFALEEPMTAADPVVGYVDERLVLGRVAG